MSTVPGAGVILTNDKQALLDLKLKRKTIDQLEKDKSLFFFSVTNNSNLISFISEADFTDPEVKKPPTMTIELIDPDHTFENNLLRLPIQKALRNKFTNMVPGEGITDKDRDYFEKLSWERHYLEKLSTMSAETKGRFLADTPDWFKLIYTNVEGIDLGIKNIPSIDEQFRLLEAEGDTRWSTSMAFENFLKDLGKEENNFYISYGVGDNVMKWAGPFSAFLTDASMEITANRDRLITLVFVPTMEGLLGANQDKKTNLKLQGYGLVRDMEAYSRPIFEKSREAIDSLKGIIEKVKGGEEMISPSVGSSSRTFLLGHVAEALPKGSKVSNDTDTLAHLISAIDFHTIIVDTIQDYLRDITSNNQLLVLYPDLNRLLYKDIHDIFLSEFSSMRNLISQRKTVKDLNKMFKGATKQRKFAKSKALDLEAWKKTVRLDIKENVEKENRIRIAKSGMRPNKGVLDYLEKNQVNPSWSHEEFQRWLDAAIDLIIKDEGMMTSQEFRALEKELRRMANDLVNLEKDFEKERDSDFYLDFLVEFVGRVLQEVGLEIMAWDIDKSKTHSSGDEYRAVIRIPKDRVGGVPPNYFTPLKNIHNKLSSRGLARNDLTDSILYEDNIEIIDIWNKYGLNYDASKSVSIFGYKPLIKKYLYGKTVSNKLAHISSQHIDFQQFYVSRSVPGPGQKAYSDQIKELMEGPEGSFLKTDLSNFYDIPDISSDEFNLDDIEKLKKNSSKENWPIFRVNTEDSNVLELDYTLNKLYHAALLGQGFSFKRKYTNFSSTTKQSIEEALKLLRLHPMHSREESKKRIKNHIKNMMDDGGDTYNMVAAMFQDTEGILRDPVRAIQTFKTEMSKNLDPKVKEDLIWLLSHLGTDAPGPKIKVGKSSDITALQTDILRQAIQDPVTLTIKTLPLFQMSSLYFALSPALLIGRQPAIVGRKKLVNDMLEIPGPDELSSFYSGKYLIQGWTHEISSTEVSSSFLLLNTVSNLAGKFR